MSTLLEGPLFIFIFTNISEKSLAIIYIYMIWADLRSELYFHTQSLCIISKQRIVYQALSDFCDDLLDLNFQRLNRSSVDILVIYALTSNHLALWPVCFTTEV